MEKILTNSHTYLLGFERNSFNEEFDPEKVKQFLQIHTNDVLVEYVGMTFLRTVPPVKMVPAEVKILKAFKDGESWFVVFELERAMSKKYKDETIKTFVYIKGDCLISPVCKQKQGQLTSVELEEELICLEGELIYQAD